MKTSAGRRIAHNKASFDPWKGQVRNGKYTLYRKCVQTRLWMKPALGCLVIAMLCNRRTGTRGSFLKKHRMPSADPILVHTAFIGLFPSAEECMCDHCVARQCCWHRGMLEAATPCVAHRKPIWQRRRYSRIFQEAISICTLNALMWIIFWNIQQGFQLFASRLGNYIQLHSLHTAKEGQQKQGDKGISPRAHTCTEGLSPEFICLYVASLCAAPLHTVPIAEPCVPQPRWLGRAPTVPGFPMFCRIKGAAVEVQEAWVPKKGLAMICVPELDPARFSEGEMSWCNSSQTAYGLSREWLCTCSLCSGDIYVQLALPGVAAGISDSTKTKSEETKHKLTAYAMSYCMIILRCSAQTFLTMILSYGRCGPLFC